MCKSSVECSFILRLQWRGGKGNLARPKTKQNKQDKTNKTKQTKGSKPKPKPKHQQQSNNTRTHHQRKEKKRKGKERKGKKCGRAKAKQNKTKQNRAEQSSKRKIRDMEPLDWDEGGQFADGTFFPPSLIMDVGRAVSLESIDTSALLSQSAGGISPTSSLGQATTTTATTTLTGTATTSSPSPLPNATTAEQYNTEPRTGMNQQDKLKSEAERRKRRALVAAASRATRAKRKKEKEYLKERNQRLEIEREKYLQKIAQLQPEVQMLRDNGAIDLAKENDLLRTEIRKHKAFIFNIVSATKQAVDVTPEEKYRHIKNGVDSGIGQVVGLAYTSVADTKTWFDSSLKAESGTLNARVQLLPIESAQTNPKRVNIRVDMPDRPENPEQLRAKLWHTWLEPSFVQRMTKALFSDDKIQVDYEEISLGNLSSIPAEDRDRLKVFYYKEEGGEKASHKRDAVFVLCWSKTNAFDQSFPTLDKTKCNLVPDSGDVFVLCSSTTIEEHRRLRAEVEGVTRVSFVFLLTLIIWNC